jgi:hypothetical protein
MGDIWIEGEAAARLSASLAISAGSAGAEWATAVDATSAFRAVLDQGILGADLQPTNPPVIHTAKLIATIVFRMALVFRMTLVSRMAFLP